MQKTCWNTGKNNQRTKTRKVKTMSQTIYAVIQSNPNFFGIDANIKLYEKEQDAKETIKQNLKSVLATLEEKFNDHNFTKDLYDTILQSNKPGYYITDKEQNQYKSSIIKLNIKDEKPYGNDTQKLDELCYYHDIIKLTLNAARIAANMQHTEKETELVHQYIQSLQTAIRMATELANKNSKENHEPYTIWAVVTETEEFGKINIQLYHQYKNAKNELTQTLWNLLTEQNDNKKLSPEKKKIWQEFNQNKNKLPDFAFENEARTQVYYGEIIPMTVNV